ncbi:putative ATPase involved in replication control, Cdc46/Mcm family [Candidatus Methanoperedens nitroreducens]|uniref:DNA helicase n=1 Tax=Candidatus Methanoperedens nitratireducens TaxID=1392998 RepID=A0A062V4G0_9EURY|nr:minichromosome maintenance protein MCM [Candidatus Methanoperedens nitroreducens]KCZ71473.1 putative ATPase involved in replication control, Cdc46/Mcm family [Candidatus Methanoperedens nitroreducens]MDJ1421102.1 minichromosome maintenance protein MCM [Candidatus Methanoperedens sp.]
MAQSSHQVWEDFFKRYYWESILDLANHYPEKRSMFVEFSDIARYDMELANELLEHPDSALAHANETLVRIDLPADVEFTNTHVRIIKLPERVQIRELRSVHINKFIAVSGLIRKATEVRPKIINAAFRCQRCEHVTVVHQSEGKFIEPYECEDEMCGRKGPFKLVHEESEFVDAQKLRVQESPDDLRGGEQPQTLDVDVDDDLAGIVAPGDRVVVTGILRSYQRSTQQGKSTFFDLVLDGVSIEIEDKEFEDIEISKEEIEEILDLGKDPQVYSKVIHSIAPSIYGYDEVKEAMALQLFSGMPKSLPDGTRIRGDIHILLVGDPGVAKSQLLRYGVRLAPRGIYTSGKSSTSAGLTATAVKDEFGEGRWTLEAGALVLADMGLACVDELDKMESDDRSSMHEAMEQQTISIAKAGIMATLKSRCALLGAANPKFGRFDRYEPIAKQINMPPALMSRFDLIFILTDEPSVSRDTAIAEHILKAHYAGQLSIRRDNIINSGITLDEITSAMEVIQPVIQSGMLRKYIAYTKRNIFPIIQDDARKQLIDFYLGLRKQGEDPNSPVPVTARQLEALIRLAEASARVRLSNIITKEDTDRVIRIVMASLKQVMTDPETGRLDADIINVGMGKSQRDRIKVLKEIIRKLEGEYKSAVPLGDIISKAEESGIKKDTVEDMIQKLKTVGEVLEVTNERFKVV